MDGPRTRRAFLTGGLAALGLAAIKSLPAAAGGVDNPLGLGQQNETDATTGLLITTQHTDGVHVLLHELSEGTAMKSRAAVGTGLHGLTHDGVGVQAEAEGSGVALLARGRVILERASGTATVRAGHKSVTIHPPTLCTAHTAIVATVNSNQAVSVKRVWIYRPDSFIIHLTNVATSDVRVGWIQIDAA